MPSPPNIEFPVLPIPSIPRIPLFQAHLGLLLGAGSIALPIAYIVYLKNRFAKQTELSLLISPPAPLNLVPTDLDLAIASEFEAPRDGFILARETLKSLPVGTADLDTKLQSDLSGLLNIYVRTTMRAFSWTPQALLMRYIIKDTAAKQTFDASYLLNCNFQVSDRVCGVYVISSRSAERIVLDLAAPPGWTGPVVKGCIVVGVEKLVGNNVRFLNETVLWRETSEKPTVLESTVGRWIHGFMVGWMIVKGVEAVTSRSRKSS